MSTNVLVLSLSLQYQAQSLGEQQSSKDTYTMWRIPVLMTFSYETF